MTPKPVKTFHLVNDDYDKCLVFFDFGNGHLFRGFDWVYFDRDTEWAEGRHAPTDNCVLMTQEEWDDME